MSKKLASAGGLADVLTNPRYRTLHAVIITVALLLHLSLHYATYYPPLREPLGNLPYFRLHVLHEAEFLLIVVYTTIVFRLTGGIAALVVTAISSIPFIMTPYLFDRPPRPGEIRDLAIEVGFILVMGALIVLLYETVARERERRIALARDIEESNAQLAAKSTELERLNSQVQAANTQLTALNQTVQANLNRLYNDLHTAVGEEQAKLDLYPTLVPKESFSALLHRISSFLGGTRESR